MTTMTNMKDGIDYCFSMPLEIQGKNGYAIVNACYEQLEDEPHPTFMGKYFVILFHPISGTKFLAFFLTGKEESPFMLGEEGFDKVEEEIEEEIAEEISKRINLKFGNLN